MTAGTSTFFNIFSEKDPSLNDAEQFASIHNQHIAVRFTYWSASIPVESGFRTGNFKLSILNKAFQIKYFK